MAIPEPMAAISLGRTLRAHVVSSPALPELIRDAGFFSGKPN